METWSIVVAGGQGSRFGSAKQYAPLAGRTVLDWSLGSARRSCDGVVLVLPAPDVASGRAAAWDADFVVAGGGSRSASVRAGLEAVPASAELVAVHDAVRPLATLQLWRAVIDAVTAGADGAVPVVPVTDTIKVIGPDGDLATLDRSTLVAVATPQAFRAVALRKAHDQGAEATDDAALVEAQGGRVAAVIATPGNLKITTPADLRLAEALMREEPPW
ncbi:MAG: 2-C-methyl-D-erythritol 4-phosphate cytidylyltransferase [Acidimicrobiales bacterium]